jgi:membrane protein DedA with SNARE-associated domain
MTTEELIGHLGYPGIMLVLILGGLGLPVPEEAPVILAAVLSRKGAMWWPLALASCFVGVLAGDFVVYFLGYFYGEKVLSFPLTRKFLTKAREVQIKGYFHRHGVKILILARFAVGFRTAAYLTAGILRLPALKLLAADLFAASLWFARWIETGIQEIKDYLVVVIVTIAVSWLLVRYYRGRRRAGRLVGPPVALTDDVPLPSDDLNPGAVPEPAAPEPAPPLAVEPRPPILLTPATDPSSSSIVSMGPSASS